MRRLWPQARFAVAAEDLGNLPSGMRRCSRTSSALLNQRRWAIPVRPLLWVSKSLDKVAAALTGMGHAVRANSVRKLLCELGFSRQANRKAEEGSRHPDRNAQFDYTNAQALAAQAANQPVISVDTKKKELVGNFRLRAPSLACSPWMRTDGDAPWGPVDLASNPAQTDALRNAQVIILERLH